MKKNNEMKKTKTNKVNYKPLTYTNFKLLLKRNEQRLDSAIEKINSGKTFSKELINF